MAVQSTQHEELFDAIMEKFEDNIYPSPTLLDILESLLTPDDKYLEILLTRIRNDQNPSLELIRRVRRIA